MEKGGYVYILASQRNGTLYTGVTADILNRLIAHRDGTASKFTAKYGVKMLVWHERHEDITDAIWRETNIKRWNRSWKLELIEADNPDWRDLGEDLGLPPLPRHSRFGGNPAFDIAANPPAYDDRWVPAKAGMTTVEKAKP